MKLRENCLCAKKTKIMTLFNNSSLLCHCPPLLSDYFNDVLTTFLDLERGNSVAVYGGSARSRILSKIS